MKYSSAVPTVALEGMSTLLDYDFVLAQEVLRDSAYAAFYAKQKAKGRFVLLDNGFHELGKPLSVPELIEACKLALPSVVVAPDELGKPKETLQQYDLMRKALGSAGLPDRVGVAVVMQGNDFTERASFFETVRHTCDILCLPFKADRISWFLELLERIPVTTQWPPRIHLLGMKSFTELKLWKAMQYDVQRLATRLSFDTTKPLKYGILKQKLSDVKDDELRGKPGWPKAPCTELNFEQWLLIYHNLAYIRRFT
jgi:hypothetical protein